MIMLCSKVQTSQPLSVQKFVSVMTFQPTHTNMDSMCVDFSEGAVIESMDVSDGVLGWLRANQQKMEQMIQRGQNMYNLEEWETYERWATNKLELAYQAKDHANNKLDATERRMQTLQREVQTMQFKLERMQTERTDLQEKIDRLEQGAETFSSVHEDYRAGMIAIEALVTRATTSPAQSRDYPPLLPIRGDERIIDRLNALVERMAQMEKMRNEEERQRTDDHWDPETSLLATQQMHDLLYSR